MSKFAQIAKMFDLELGERFNIEGKIDEHMFTEEGLINCNNKTLHSALLRGIISGEAKIINKPWMPTDGSTYYVPCLISTDKYQALYNNCNETTKQHFNDGIICRTKEQAVELHSKLVNFLKNKSDSGNNLLDKFLEKLEECCKYEICDDCKYNHGYGECEIGMLAETFTRIELIGIIKEFKNNKGGI